jgi:hypothetical protein
MAYIGNSPANVGNYQVVDDISSTFNGVLTSFALTVLTLAINPAKSGQLLVSINGVLQEPDDTGTEGFKVQMSSAELALTGGLSLGDNVKAKFGAGDDLQIYHDSTTGQSFISESGGGSFLISGTDVYIRTPAGENSIFCDTDGTVTLYHDNSPKLATTSTGIDVTGAITCDGLEVTDGGFETLKIESTDNDAVLELRAGGDINTDWTMRNDESASNNLEFRYNNSPRFFITKDSYARLSGTGAKFEIANSNVDISMDTSASGQLKIDGAGYAGAIALDADAMNVYTNSASRDVVLGVNETEILRAKPTGVDVTGSVTCDGFTSTGIDDNATSTAITIDASENVGIGTTSPQHLLETSQSASAKVIGLTLQNSMNANSTDTGVGIKFKGSSYSDADETRKWAGIYGIANATYHNKMGLSFYTNNDRTQEPTEKLQITSDGRGLSQFTAKAWVNFNGAGTVAIRDSHNVSSITDGGIGKYTVNITNALANVNGISLSDCMDNGNNGRPVNSVVMTTSTVLIYVSEVSSGTPNYYTRKDLANIQCLVFGD